MEGAFRMRTHAASEFVRTLFAGSASVLSLRQGKRGSAAWAVAMVLAITAMASSANARNWTWIGGQLDTDFAVYGTQGAADPANSPGARKGAVSWTDSLGNRWLFGGSGYDASGSSGYLNDLWKYDVTSGTWTWMKGSVAVDQYGTYGTQGIAAPANTPGGRDGAVSWADDSGNLWLFGGNGCSSSFTGVLNDLWKYDAASGNWTWVKGSNTIAQPGTYGTQGVPDPANTPGGRYGAVSWTDSVGDMWLFGGYGRAAAGSIRQLNDLWKYSVATGNWTWMKGSNVIDQCGTYGTQGIADAANTPGGRRGAVSWSDISGGLWLFGGDGYAASGGTGYLNDLWKYDVAAGNWIWMKGSNAVGQFGTYGTQGVAAHANVPGGRWLAASCSDSSGSLWLFGGSGFGASGGSGSLNDFWRYDAATGDWTWMKGSNAVGQSGTYGTQGVAAVTNNPGGRRSTVCWTDSSGSFWFFGGSGYAALGFGPLNDLWAYDVATGNWTWMNGSSSTTPYGTYGTYGTRGVAGPSNTPGARYGAVSWTDSDGNLWLFSGSGYAASASGTLNDLWKYDTASRNWTWMKGDYVTDRSGTYGTRGVAGPSNAPGARYGAVSWTDSSGSLWLFGGYGYAASGNGRLNDLWKYDVASGNWTWMKGSNAANQFGTYGTQGVVDPANTPGGREGPVSWTDSSGNLWLFGGWGYEPSGNGFLNDLWKYDIATNNWTWMKGSNAVYQYGTYGTQGLADPANTPGARHAAVSSTDSSGSLWLFGGDGYAASGGIGYLNDLWKYDVATGDWTWMKGSNAVGPLGTYGTQGAAAQANTPGARGYAASCTDSSGNLWLLGGSGCAASGNGYLNDLWKYDTATGNWGWMKGSNAADQNGTYGTQGIAALGNTPGGRRSAVVWTGDSGNLWLFGGDGLGAHTSGIHLMDLWRLCLAAPTGPGATDIGTTQITWTWSDNSLEETGYNVWADPGSSAPVTLQTTTTANAAQWTMTGLTPNTQYSFQVAASPGGDSEKTETFSTWTLAAVPGAPMLSDPTDTSLGVAIAAGVGNPGGTEYALHCETASQWVQANGTLGAMPVWRTAGSWGTVVVTGLTRRTSYSFTAMARNGALVETPVGLTATLGTVPVRLSRITAE